MQPGDAFGLERAQWDAWILTGAQGFDGGVIDLLEWQEPRPIGTPPAHFYEQGFQRVGLMVPDLDAAMRAVEQHGGELWSREPSLHDDIRLVHASDPDGVAVELVEVGSTAVSFVGIVCADLEHSVGWYRALGFREVARFASRNDDSRHLRIDGPSSFAEVMMVAPKGGIAVMLLGFDQPGVVAAQPRPAHALGVWRLALLMPDLGAGVRELDRLGVERLSDPVTMSMGDQLPPLRFLCCRGPDHEILELIEQPG